jgi:hypothetical protein
MNGPAWTPGIPIYRFLFLPNIPYKKGRFCTEYLAFFKLPITPLYQTFAGDAKGVSTYNNF